MLTPGGQRMDQRSARTQSNKPTLQHLRESQASGFLKRERYLDASSKRLGIVSGYSQLRTTFGILGLIGDFAFQLLHSLYTWRYRGMDKHRNGKIALGELCGNHCQMLTNGLSANCIGGPARFYLDCTAPTKNSYLNYGFYDGNVARGVQTGLTGPHFNGYYFNILEAGVDWVAAGKYPGQFGAGLWYQTGLLRGPPGISENGTGGFYLFGGQRIWGRSMENPASDGKDKIVIPASERGQNASISTFVQFGVNNSETLPVEEYLGLGFTGFGLVSHRPGDSLGVGVAWS